VERRGESDEGGRERGTGRESGLIMHLPERLMPSFDPRRWGDRWASEREQIRRNREECNMGKRASEDQNEELWDLELYGAPTYGPGLS
jgi:hypothetical protein